MGDVDATVLIALLTAAFMGGSAAAYAVFRAGKGKDEPVKPATPAPLAREDTGRFEVQPPEMYEMAERLRSMHDQAATRAKSDARALMAMEKMARSIDQLTMVAVAVDEIRDDVRTLPGRLEVRIADASTRLQEEMIRMRADLAELVESVEAMHVDE